MWERWHLWLWIDGDRHSVRCICLSVWKRFRQRYAYKFGGVQLGRKLHAARRMLSQGHCERYRCFFRGCQISLAASIRPLHVEQVVTVIEFLADRLTGKVGMAGDWPKSVPFFDGLS